MRSEYEHVQPALDSCMLTNPLRFIDNTAVRYGLLGGQLLDTRAQLLGAEGLISGDAYEFLRDGSLQRREYLIADGELEDSFLDDEF